jgi:regulator of PEP synthase PpsR (kinase-PPPase family)
VAPSRTVAPAPTNAVRTVFFVSDGTGITAETFGHSLLAQFEGVPFKQLRLPFIDTMEKAGDVIEKINNVSRESRLRPIVFSTLVDPEINYAVRCAHGLFLDMFQTFVEPLEKELGIKSTHSIGRSHNIADSKEYNARIEAINFSLAHDDGQTHGGLADADVILVGVSRSGKTPTSLYLAMQYGIKAANYPLIPEDFERQTLPSALPKYRAKLFGLSITPERLAEVRNERRPKSKYAALETCRNEVAQAEAMMRREGIRWLSSTTKSIEEIAATILQEIRLERRSF